MEDVGAAGLRAFVSILRRYQCSLLIGLVGVAVGGLTGCATSQERSVHVYSPDCTPQQMPQKIDVLSVSRYLDCGEKEKAKEIARTGTKDGQLDMLRLYLTLLEADNELDEGLAYALKYAEQGDEASIDWSLKIVRKYRIKTLTAPVSEMYLGLFEKKVPYLKWLLDDYLEYSAENVQYNGDITISYSARYLQLARPYLTRAEYEKAAAKLKENTALHEKQGLGK